MTVLGVAILILAMIGVVCGIVNIFYNPDEYEYTDYRQGYRTDCRQDYRTDEPEGGRRD